MLMLEGPVLSWKTQVCYPHADLPSLIPAYSGLQQRWDHTKQYLAFLDELEATRSESRQRIALLRQGTMDDAVAMFCHAISLDGHNYRTAFESSVVNHALRTAPTKIIASEFMSRVLRKIKLRLFRS
jgi:hypothetical protein